MLGYVLARQPTVILSTAVTSFFFYLRNGFGINQRFTSVIISAAMVVGNVLSPKMLTRLPLLSKCLVQGAWFAPGTWQTQSAKCYVCNVSYVCVLLSVLVCARCFSRKKIKYPQYQKE